MATGRIYTRKSRHLGDPEDPSLLAHHVAALRRLAAEQGIDLVEVIEEIGSGETIDQRPCFRDLILAYEQGRYRDEALLVVAVDRLCRGDGREMGRVRDALARARILLVTPGRTYDLQQPDDDLLHGFVQLLARHELARYKQRVKVKLDQMTREGKCVGGMVPFGYIWDFREKKPLPDPDRFPILQSWCREILMESSSVLSRRYGISFDRICATLRNPTICGYPARRWEPHNGRRPWKSRTFRLPRSEWMWPERQGDYTPACTLEEWQAIQAVLDARTMSRSATWHTDGWCRRLLVFHGTPDGPPLPGSVGLSWRSYPTHYPTYLLRQRGDQGQFKAGPFISRETVHAATTTALRQLFERPERLLTTLHAYQVQQEARNASRGDSATSAALSVERLRASLSRLVAMEVAATDPEHLRALAEQREAIQKQLAALRSQPAPVAVPAFALPQALLMAMAGGFDAVWGTTADAEKAVVATGLLSALHVWVDSYRGRRQSRREVIGWDYHERAGGEEIRLR